MRRIDIFNSLETDAWYSRLFKRLTAKEKTYCQDKIKESEDLSVNQFCEMAQRFGSDQVEKSFKNSLLMAELLLVVGTKK